MPSEPLKSYTISDASAITLLGDKGPWAQRWVRLEDAEAALSGAPQTGIISPLSAGGEIDNGAPQTEDEGCTCQGCGRRYRVDVLVPDALWEEIKPRTASEGAGLLCGRCIVDRLEARGFGAWWLSGAPQTEERDGCITALQEIAAAGEQTNPIWLAQRAQAALDHV